MKKVLRRRQEKEWQTVHKTFLLNDKTIIELDFAKYRDLSVSPRSIIVLCVQHQQIIDLLATDKSQYFAQPRPIIIC